MKDTDKMQIIINEVCDYLGLTESQIHCKCQKREYVVPRQWIFYFGRKFTKLSLSQIGTQFEKDHATVLHSCSTIDNLIKYNGYRSKYEHLNSVLLDKLQGFEWNLDKAAVSMAQL